MNWFVYFHTIFIPTQISLTKNINPIIMARRIVGIHERLPILESLPLSFQHLTAMFGATILVPILLGVDPAIAPVSYTHLDVYKRQVNQVVVGSKK